MSRYKYPDLGCADWRHEQKTSLQHTSLTLVSLSGTSLGKWLHISAPIKDTEM